MPPPLKREFILSDLSRFTRNVFTYELLPILSCHRGICCDSLTDKLYHIGIEILHAKYLQFGKADL